MTVVYGVDKFLGDIARGGDGRCSLARRGKLQGLVEVYGTDNLLGNFDLAHGMDEIVGVDQQPLGLHEESHQVLEWHH
jgi:hypothetical protein